MFELIEREIVNDQYYIQNFANEGQRFMPGLGAVAAELASKLTVKSDALVCGGRQSSRGKGADRMLSSGPILTVASGEILVELIRARPRLVVIAPVRVQPGRARNRQLFSP